MDKNTFLWLIGILVTIFVGVWGRRVINKKKLKQVQRADRSGIAIQSGRDTKIGKKDE